MNDYDRLDWMGREELEDWNQAKILVPALIIIGPLFPLVVFMVSQGNPYWWFAVGVSMLPAGLCWFFAVIFYVISTPLSIHKVNGHWEMNR